MGLPFICTDIIFQHFSSYQNQLTLIHVSMYFLEQKGKQMNSDSSVML